MVLGTSGDLLQPLALLFMVFAGFLIFGFPKQILVMQLLTNGCGFCSEVLLKIV